VPDWPEIGVSSTPDRGATRQPVSDEVLASVSEINSQQQHLDDVRKLADGGRYTEALEVLSAEDVGLTIEGKLWQGILLLNLEQNEEAVRLFRQCSFLRPEVPEYRQWLAVTYEALGRTVEAEREFRNASEVGDR
jgi:tetratricopeptide (TPR) repeat protein